MSAVGVLNGNYRNGDYYDYRKMVEAGEKKEAEDRAAAKQKIMFDDVKQEVRDSFETQAEYDAWWEASPEVGFFEHAEAYLLEIKAQDRNNILATRRDSILAAMSEEAMSRETALKLIDELAEIEAALQYSGYVDLTNDDWFKFDKIEEIEF